VHAFAAKLFAEHFRVMPLGEREHLKVLVPPGYAVPAAGKARPESIASIANAYFGGSFRWLTCELEPFWRGAWAFSSSLPFSAPLMQGNAAPVHLVPSSKDGAGLVSKGTGNVTDRFPDQRKGRLASSG
jgi:hypothetical protein